MRAIKPKKQAPGRVTLVKIFSINSAVFLPGLTPGMYNHVFGDAHIYEDHFDAVKEQLQRTSKKFPKLHLNKDVKNIDDFTMNDFEVIGYDPDPFIKASMSV